MAEHWTTADIARELGLGSRETARQRIKRWRKRGIELDVTVGLDGVHRYVPEQIRTAAQAMPGRGRPWPKAGEDSTDDG